MNNWKDDTTVENLLTSVTHHAIMGRITPGVVIRETL